MKQFMRAEAGLYRWRFASVGTLPVEASGFGLVYSRVMSHICLKEFWPCIMSQNDQCCECKTAHGKWFCKIVCYHGSCCFCSSSATQLGWTNINIKLPSECNNKKPPHLIFLMGCCVCDCGCTCLHLDNMLVAHISCGWHWSVFLQMTMSGVLINYSTTASLRHNWFM